MFLSREYENQVKVCLDLLKNAFAFTLLLLLLSCGGGGASSTLAPPSTPPTTPPVTPTVPQEELKPAPKGIYHSAGIISGSNTPSTLVRSDINDKSYIAGTLVRVGWNILNPEEGVFDFSSIEKEFEQAALFNTFINLAIVDSKEIPAYVLEKCQTFVYTFRTETDQTTCLPWDQEYQKYKRELISALGDRFDEEPTLSAVYFTYAAMTNGIEMHWRVDESEYAATGYTAEKLAQAYNDVMDMYIDAFLKTSIIMEIHEVFNEANLAESAFAHCYDAIGERCGVAIWWCASRMATDPKEAEYKVYHIAKQATSKSFGLCQSIGSFTDSPERFDQGQGWTTEEAFEIEMNFFIDEGFTSFELWTSDITNPNLISIIQNEIVPRLD